MALMVPISSHWIQAEQAELWAHSSSRMSKIIEIPPLSGEVKSENCSVGQIAVAYSFTPEVRKCQS